MTRWVILLLGILIAAPSYANDPLNKDLPIAFLGIIFSDLSTEGDYDGERPDQSARTELIENYIEDEFTKRGFRFVDLTPIEEQLQANSNILDCRDCDLRMAQRLDAPLVMIGEIKKVSNLVLSMNLIMKDSETGALVRGISVDFRSNTDASWTRAARYILKYHYFGE